MTNPMIAESVISTLVVALLLVSPSLAISDVGPFIVAHKKVSLRRVKADAERVFVSVDIYNRGTATAYDVSFLDHTWSSKLFAVVNGDISRTWERLEAGGLVSHSFELEANEQAIYIGAPAVIRFRIPTKAALQEAYSTPIPPLNLLAEKPPQEKFYWAKTLLAEYGSLVSVISAVVLFVYLISTPSKSSPAKSSKKRR